jgi:hypothetical protein
MREIPERRFRSASYQARRALSEGTSSPPLRLLKEGESGGDAIRAFPRMGCEEFFDDAGVAVRDERVGCGGRDRLGRIAERVLEQMLRCVVIECGDREDHIAARRLGEFGELETGGVGPSGLRGERRALGRADVLGFAAWREDRVPRDARRHDDDDDDDEQEHLDARVQRRAHDVEGTVQRGIALALQRIQELGGIRLRQRVEPFDEQRTIVRELRARVGKQAC